MAQIADQMINLDTDHYCEAHSDLKKAVKGMSVIDKKIWLLTHYLKHGHAEGRRYRLKTQKAGDGGDRIVVKAPEKPELPKPKKNGSDIGDVQQLIKNFQQRYGHSDGGVRDRDIVKKQDGRGEFHPKPQPQIHIPEKKTFFWEIGQ